jgi:hypothetical protein
MAALLPGMARAQQADPAGQGLETLWESLWHQSGVPTRVVRWEGPVHWRLVGRNLPRHREPVRRALAAVSEVTGVRLIEATPDSNAPVTLTIEIVGNQALEDHQPCVTTLSFRSEAQIDTAQVQMRERDVWRCAHHEAMHVMGVRGHPSGETVLSYFPKQVDRLLPLDQVMLRAWYSPRMRPGMTPFEALPVLADAWLATQPDPVVAAQIRDRFYARTLARMQAYALGQGDVPAIVRRSGKATQDGVRQGRSEMGYFLGVAYLEGLVVPAADLQMALDWLERSASAGNRRAQARLAGMR